MQENVLAEAMGSVRHLWRHRPGNEIPALIEDCFSNLGYLQKDGTIPVICARRKTAEGWHLIINLPPGVSFNQVRRDKDFFQDACNAWIEMEWKHGRCHMNIQAGELPESIEYDWDSSLHRSKELPIPIGYTRTGPITLDLTESPHLLVGGSTGYGKTNFVRSVVHSLIDQALIVIIDLKGIDFAYLDGRCALATTEEEAFQVLTLLNKEHDQRVQVLRRNHAVKIQECPEMMPYIVLVVDELAEIRNKETMAKLDRIVRLARATGISVIAASQRTSVQVIPGDTRSNFVARICFRVATEQDSRVVLGEDCGMAGQLAAVKGRAIYRFGLETREVQTMFLSRARAGEMSMTMPVEGGELIEQPQVTRLRPR